MGSIFKNITLSLGIITAIFGGYYLYVTNVGSLSEEISVEDSLQIKLANTSVFIAHSQELSKIDLDLSLFEDQRFGSLRLYTQPVEDQSTGRTNPFSETIQ